MHKHKHKHMRIQTRMPMCNVHVQVSSLVTRCNDPLDTCTVSTHFDGACHFPYFHGGRKPIRHLACGTDYTVALLDNGELRSESLCICASRMNMLCGGRGGPPPKGASLSFRHDMSTVVR